ncbi:MAG TPA: hypothetical protein VMM84_06885 [Pyrinomonadaceae bacterium]|nr:hypothetical protein [Pyrinomonadaceae bacterium]
MTAAAISLSGSGSLLTEGTPGVGSDHKYIRDLLRATYQGWLDSISLGKTLQDTYKQLDQVVEDCGRSDWDAYGAEPVLFESLENAKRFALALPFSLAAPEVSAEPDGEITFEWYSNPTRVFSVSIGPHNELTYAGIFGASRAYGTEVFHDEIPEIILSHIKRVAF